MQTTMQRTDGECDALRARDARLAGVPCCISCHHEMRDDAVPLIPLSFRGEHVHACCSFQYGGVMNREIDPERLQAQFPVFREIDGLDDYWHPTYSGADLDTPLARTTG